MFIILAALILSSGEAEKFKEHSFLCGDYNFSYMRDNDPVVYMSIRGRDYKTKYDNTDKLTAHIRRQCRGSLNVF
jgi:hypothetical protein